MLKKCKNSDTFYRIRIVLLTWVESTILIQSENTFAQLRTLHANFFNKKASTLLECLLCWMIHSPILASTGIAAEDLHAVISRFLMEPFTTVETSWFLASFDD